MVRPDDFLKLSFGAAIAAVDVRVKAAKEFGVAAPDFARLGRRRKIKGQERSLLELA
jgi:hypothetical protein